MRKDLIYEMALSPQPSTCWLAIDQGYLACCWCGYRSRQITRAFKTRANNTRACAGLMIRGMSEIWDGGSGTEGLSCLRIRSSFLMGRFVVKMYSILIHRTVWAENIILNLPNRGNPIGKGDGATAAEPKSLTYLPYLFPWNPIELYWHLFTSSSYLTH